MSASDLRYVRIDPILFRPGDRATIHLNIDLEVHDLDEERLMCAIEWRPIFVGDPPRVFE